MKKKMLEVAHIMANDLYNAGIIDSTTMREFDELCLPPVKKHGRTRRPPGGGRAGSAETN